MEKLKNFLRKKKIWGVTTQAFGKGSPRGASDTGLEGQGEIYWNRKRKTLPWPLWASALHCSASYPKAYPLLFSSVSSVKWGGSDHGTILFNHLQSGGMEEGLRTWTTEPDCPGLECPLLTFTSYVTFD